jgi:CrcB protein
MTVLALSIAGAAGAVARFLLDGAVRALSDAEFPYGTALVNVTGSLVMGLIVGLVLFRGAPSELGTIAGTGFCGGYTTFSTASFETIRLAEQGYLRAALVNALATLALCTAAAGAGLALMSAV